MRFRDRREAGRLLGARLLDVASPATVVLGLPRGGVVVAFEVAQILRAPLDVVVVRKLGAPNQPELAMGALAEDGGRLLNDRVVGAVGATDADLDVVAEREGRELARRVQRYRGEAPMIPVRGRTAVLVDDGLATGATALAAARYLRRLEAGRVVLAVPVSPEESLRRLSGEVDDLVCLLSPPHLYAVGQAYEWFGDTEDEEVVRVLELATGFDRVERREAAIQMPEGLQLPGEIAAPGSPIGVVVFAHGSGSGRLSPRNLAVAESLRRRGLATVLFDLLTPEEAEDRANVFDTELLGSRLEAAARWTAGQDEVRGLPVGLFGASTGAAAALRAAAALTDPDSGFPARVAAVVSRGGRPDLAMDVLEQVTVPTLLIVGERDHWVLEANEAAGTNLGGPWELEIVPGATHLFEEPGALEGVAELAGSWFARACVGAPAAAQSL
jgi:predicted phosphoribosyltransferase/dienelactone hydrolase